MIGFLKALWELIDINVMKLSNAHSIAQEIKFSIEHFLSKSAEIYKKLRI